MPSAGNSDNLRPNLGTVAGLTGKIGAKLSYDKETGLFSIQEPGKLQSLARTFSRDSIENEEYFGAPIRELFAAAHAQGHDVSRALNGLRALRRSYTGDKLRILDAVIEDAELGVKKERAHGIDLRKRYDKYVIFGFAQEMFLPQSEAGVCYSLTVHWARRILMGKTHFGKSKKTLDQVSLVTLDANQKGRIMRKVDRDIRPLHAALKQYQNVHQVTRPGLAMMELAKSDRFAKYGDILVGIAMRYSERIEARARGSQIIGELLLPVVVRNRDAGTYTIFLVNFSTATQAHTIGIHLEGTTLHFFDPNCGEFAFQEAFKADRKRFLDDWWQAFYMVNDRAVFTKVDLEGVKLKQGVEFLTFLP